MGKLLNLGLSLERVIELTTSAPAKVINFDRCRVEGLGSLEPGATGDVAILELVEGEHRSRTRRATSATAGSARVPSRRSRAAVPGVGPTPSVRGAIRTFARVPGPTAAARRPG
jgi:predicted amidohydrolase